MNGYSADRMVRTGIVSGRLLRPVLPHRIVNITAQEKSIPPLVRWSFLLFAFTIPFEALELPIMTGLLSLGKISGLLFFAVYFFYYHSLTRKRSFPHPPHAMWWFVGYIAIYTLNGLFISEELVSQFLIYLSTRVQLIVFFWLTSSLLEEEKMARSILLTFSIASAIVALGMILRVPGFSSPEI